MTEKQKRFCEEYLIDCNGTQAAIRAGYSEKTATKIAAENLTKPDIREYIDEKLAEMSSQRTADAREVMEYLTSVMRGEHKEQVLRLVGNGTQKIDSMNVTEKDRLKAAELIGKRYGLFKESVDVNGVVPVVLCDDVKE
jgi:phage terminase small subunit